MDISYAFQQSSTPVLPVILTIANETCLRDVMELVVHNFPDITKSIPFEELIFTTKEGTVLSTDRTVGSYGSDIDLLLRRRLYPLTIFVNDQEQKILNVDFSIPVHKIMGQIWRAFGVPPKDFTMKRLSPDIAIDPNKTLSAQNVPVQSAFSIKYKEFQKKGIFF